MLVVSPAASSLRQLGGFFKGGCCVSSSANYCAQRVVSGAQQVLSEHLRFDVVSSVDSGHLLLIGRDRVSISGRIGTVCGIVCQSQNSV